MNINKIINEYREYITGQIRNRKEVMKRAADICDRNKQLYTSLDIQKINNGIQLFTYVDFKKYTLSFAISMTNVYKSGYFEYRSPIYHIPTNEFQIVNGEYDDDYRVFKVIDIQELIEQDCYECEELLTTYCKNIEFLNPDINDCDSPSLD